ncbi:MAG TPA: hypothetical protein VFH48_24015 [Chloroflexota bacterium]|nr:hypothetical protein [Chloroflexota bacterium]
MNLLISETLTVDTMLDRAIPWTEDVFEYLASLAADDVRDEHESRLVRGPEPAWYELRLTALRQAILGIFQAA